MPKILKANDFVERITKRNSHLAGFSGLMKNYLYRDDATSEDIELIGATLLTVLKKMLIVISWMKWNIPGVALCQKK